MKRKEVKEMIKSAFLSEMGSDPQYADEKAYGFYNEAEVEEDLDEMLARLSEEEIEEGDDKVVDPYLAEAEEGEDAEEEIEDELDIDVDTEEETDGGEEKSTNDSIVIDKKIVSLSSLPGETRKILDTLETLRAQAEEFGDQKFMTQVGNTITFFTRDFVVAGDQPTMAKVDESLEILKMRKLAGLLTEGEYAKALLKEEADVITKEEAREYAESWEDDDVLNDFDKTFGNQEKVAKSEFVSFFENYIDDMSETKYIQSAWRKLSSGEGL
jgi:hypothetical protein